ncbi:MAG: tRNA (adenosine(37)-N6)-dimethylallyltransferase MiaA [bacterium]|nr:tRNA (adenosine(37)-N6)-dimethylallyltransferase MiaA [bacterium]
MKPKVIAIVGPTACGKTKMAIDLAKQIDGEIVSADSRLVYKGFDIASAKPTLEEQEEIPHHLIDIVEPEHDYSVAEFYDDATIAIKDILSRKKTPIVAGGTGLYFRVLLEDYDLPRVEANPELREELENKSKEDLLEELKSLDNESFLKLQNSNKRRIVRALEVTKILGQPFSKVSGKKELEYDVEWRMPQIPSREWLYDRINKRVDVMYEKGIVEETKNLIKKHGRIKNIVDTIGYKEILTYLDKTVTLEEALDKLKQHSRNYAKRQLTWFRKNPELTKFCQI